MAMLLQLLSDMPNAASRWDQIFLKNTFIAQKNANQLIKMIFCFSDRYFIAKGEGFAKFPRKSPLTVLRPWKAGNGAIAAKGCYCPHLGHCPLKQRCTVPERPPLLFPAADRFRRCSARAARVFSASDQA